MSKIRTRAAVRLTRARITVPLLAAGATRRARAFMVSCVVAGIAALLAPFCASAEPQPCANGDAPQAAVMSYLSAMHKHRFEDAYDHVTENMTDGRSRAEWAALQARAYQPGRVDIYGVDVRRAMAADDDPACHEHALVPNILSSRDRLNEHGSVEFEVYRVRLDDGQWRVDSQQTLFDEAGISLWFPNARPLENAP